MEFENKGDETKSEVENTENAEEKETEMREEKKKQNKEEEEVYEEQIQEHLHSERDGVVQMEHFQLEKNTEQEQHNNEKEKMHESHAEDKKNNQMHEKQNEYIKSQKNSEANAKTPVTSFFKAPSFSSAFSQINPIAVKVNKGIQHVIQYTGEKIGVAKSITELPPHYTTLEIRIDRLKSVYENMVRLAIHQINPGQVFRFSSYEEYNTAVSIERVDLAKIKTNSNTSQYVGAANAVGNDSLLGQGLLKTGETYDQIIKQRLKMYTNINEKTIQRMNTSLEIKFDRIHNMRKMVSYTRIKLDSLKSMPRNLVTEEIKEEIKSTETELEKLVSEATEAMREMLRSKEAIECVGDYHWSLLNYFKESVDLLNLSTSFVNSLREKEIHHQEQFKKENMSQRDQQKDKEIEHKEEEEEELTKEDNLKKEQDEEEKNDNLVQGEEEEEAYNKDEEKYHNYEG